MPSANEQLQDLQTLNQHLTEQHKSEVIALMLKFFKRMERLIQKEITLAYDEDGILPRDKSILWKKIKQIQQIEIDKIKTRILDDAERYLGVESGIYKKQLEKVFEDVSDFVDVKNVDPSKLKRIFERTKISMDKGKIYSLTSLWLTFSDSVKEKLLQNVESAYTLDKPRKEFISDVNSGFKINQNQLGAVIAVIIQQAYGVAIKEMNKVNTGIIKGYSWDSVMDTRTSPFCIEHSGQEWYYDAPELSTLPWEIYAPAHFKCRSSNPPITKSYTEMGIEPDQLTQKQKEFFSGTATSQTYAEFFEKQPPRVQKKILGPARYNAFTNGTPIDSFYSDGRRLTLKELNRESDIISEEYLRYVE